jgi:DNA transformation protein
MAEIKGDKLFVNLGPSQARRRLKGFGHGVRKVQSAGRHRAVIIHTATEGHLRELEAKFADVGFAHSEHDLNEPIENLRNLGPKSAAWLRGVGIGSIAELDRRGPVVAYRLVKQREPAASLNLLWGLAAGLRGIDWRELTDQEKRELLQSMDDRG